MTGLQSTSSLAMRDLASHVRTFITEIKYYDMRRATFQERRGAEVLTRAATSAASPSRTGFSSSSDPTSEQGPNCHAEPVWRVVVSKSSSIDDDFGKDVPPRVGRWWRRAHPRPRRLGAAGPDPQQVRGSRYFCTPPGRERVRRAVGARGHLDRAGASPVRAHICSPAPTAVMRSGD